MKLKGSALAWAALDLCTCLILVIYTMIAPPTKSVSIPTQGLYAITQSCPANNLDDVDLYVRDPQGNIAYFANMTAGLMHLEQDVIPGVNTVEGSFQIQTGDDERTIIRGIVPGEYVVNEHLYSNEMSGGLPVSCRVSLWSIKNGFSEVVSRIVSLPAQGDEKTAFRFTLDGAGHITNVNYLPLDIVYTAATGQSQGVTP